MAALAIGFGAPAPAAALDTEVRTRTIEQFRIGSAETRFGALEFIGGLEMVGDTRHFGAISGFRFRDAGGDFIAVTDTGFWLFGRLVRDAGGRPAGLSSVRLDQIRDRSGNPIPSKYHADAEGLAIRDATATVSFERNHRISDFRLAPAGMGKPLRNIDYLVPSWELRRNRGFETVAFAPAASPLAGATVIVSEKSLDRQGNVFGAVLDGPRKGVFSVRKLGAFDITDGAFLPDGDLILLERSYSIGAGVAMQLRRIAGDTITAGALLDGEVLLTADMAYQIDNMEGLDVWVAPDGSTRLALVSDDNHSLLQRNLYLEFRLAE